MVSQLFRFRRTESVLVLAFSLVAAAAGVWSEVVAQQARDDLLTAEGAIVEAHWEGGFDGLAQVDVWTAANVQRPGFGQGDWIALSGQRVNWTSPPSIVALSALEPLDEESLQIGANGIELDAEVGTQFDEWLSRTGTWRSSPVTAKLNMLLLFDGEPSPQSDDWRSRHRTLTGSQWGASFHGSDWQSRPPIASVSFVTPEGKQQDFLPAVQSTSHRAGVGTGTFVDQTR